MSDSTTLPVSSGKTIVFSARCGETNKYGLRATRPDFWVINPDFDHIDELANGCYRVRQGKVCGIYDSIRFLWLAPVRFATARLDKSGNCRVRRYIDLPEEIYVVR